MTEPHPLETSLASWFERVVLLAGITTRITSARLAAVQMQGRVTFVVEVTTVSGETTQLEMLHDGPCPAAAVRTAAAGLRIVEDAPRAPTHREAAAVFRHPFALKRGKP